MKVDGVFDEDWVSNFVVQKHVEYLVENDHGKGISLIHNGRHVFNLRNKFIIYNAIFSRDNSLIREALKSPAELFQQQLKLAESVINDSALYEAFDLNLMTE